MKYLKTEENLAEMGSEMLSQSRYYFAMKIDQAREPEETMNHNKIPFLQIESYEHPWDKSARDALEQVPGFTGLTRKLNEIGFERLLRIQYTGSSLKVSKTNFPELHNALEEACDILGITNRPDLYL